MPALVTQGQASCPWHPSSCMLQTTKPKRTETDGYFSSPFANLAEKARISEASEERAAADNPIYGAGPSSLAHYGPFPRAGCRFSGADCRRRRESKIRETGVAARVLTCVTTPQRTYNSLAKTTRLQERWLSGRKRGFAKPVALNGARRFESCPLR